MSGAPVPEQLIPSLDHNGAKTLDELFEWTEVALFDLSSDPAEVENLALDRRCEAARGDERQARSDYTSTRSTSNEASGGT